MADTEMTSTQHRPATSTNGTAGEAARRQGEWLQNALTKWLAATAQAQSVLVCAQTDASRKIAALQVSIMRAQDELKPDNELAQQALAKEIDCGEQLNRTARRLDRLVVDMDGLALTASKLSSIIGLISEENAASFLAPAPGGKRVEALLEGVATGRLLADLRTKMERLGRRTDDAAVAAVWECVWSLQPIVALVSQQAVAAMADLRRLTASIDELDREIVLTRSA